MISIRLISNCVNTLYIVIVYKILFETKFCYKKEV